MANVSMPLYGECIYCSGTVVLCVCVDDTLNALDSKKPQCSIKEYWDGSRRVGGRSGFRLNPLN